MYQRQQTVISKEEKREELNMTEKNKNAAPALDAGTVNAAAESIRAFSKQIGACSDC